MNYYKFSIQADPEEREVVMAMLSLLPFDMFLENDSGFDAYVPESDYDGSVDDQLKDLQTRFAFSFSKEWVQGQNWNIEWESNFHPVVVDDFCGVRAEFHEPLTNVEHELVITPRMAFGTGHHETTYMMIQLMRDLPFNGKRVLDYGCGSGILSILASRLGAGHVDAVDIEWESCENTMFNCQTNDVGNVKAWHGTLDAVPQGSYGIILANINRNVILDSLPSLFNKTKPGGILIVSGFIQPDGELLENALVQNEFQVRKTLRKHDWLAIHSFRL